MIEYLLSKNRFFFAIIFIFFSLSDISAQSCNGYPTGNVFPGNIMNYSPECAPVTANWYVEYSKVDDGTNPNNVSFDFVWGDGVTENIPYSSGKITYTAASRKYNITAKHVYPASTTVCQYIPKVYLNIKGIRCATTEQTQFVFTWDTDDRGSGQLLLNESATGVNIYRICEGQSAALTFIDNSTFNCNLSASPDNPNQETRWIQFKYGTNTNATYAATAKIPCVKVGTKYVTNKTGTRFPLNGSVQTINKIANGSGLSTSTVYINGDSTIGKKGCTFEITLCNWNYCNKYDDGVTPVPSNQPKTTTAIIEIIESPGMPDASDLDICYGESRTLTATAKMGGTLRWYSSSAKTTLLATGNSYTPTNSASGTYKFYVTETLGTTGCEGPAREVTLKIREQLSISSLNADAGDNIVCINETDAKYIVSPTPPTNTVGGATAYSWATTGTWTETATTSTSKSYTIVSGAGTKVVTATLGYSTLTTAGSSCPVSKTLNVTVNALPTATFDYDQSICNNTKPTFRISNLTGSGSYTAKYTDGVTTFNFNNGTSFTGTKSYTHASNLATAGVKTFYMSSLTDGNCTSTYVATSGTNKAAVTVREALSAPGTISGISTTCATESNIEYTSSSSQFPSTTNGGTTRFRWKLGSPVNGWTILDNTTTDKLDNVDTKMTYNSGTGNGIINVLLEYTNAVTASSTNFCTSTVTSKSVTVVTRPVVTISSSTPKICTGTKPSLTFNISGGTAPFELVYKLNGTSYTETNITGTSRTITFGTALTSVANSTDYLFELVSVKSLTSPFCVGSLGNPSNITISVYANPTGSISPSATICKGENSPIEHTLTGSGPYDVELKNTTSGQVFTLSAITSGYKYNVSPSLTSNFQLQSVKLTNSPNCAATSLGSAITITVNPPPTTALAGSDDVLCGSTAYTLNANTPTVGLGSWSIVSMPISAGVLDSIKFSSTTIPNPVLTLQNSKWGDYVLQWKISQNPCTPSTSNVKISFGGTPDNPNAGPDSHACFPGYTLNANSSISIGTGEWSYVTVPAPPGTATFSDKTKYNSTVTVTQAGTYYFVWSISSGSCSVKRDTVEIIFDSQPIITNVFNDTICKDQTSLAISATTQFADDTKFSWKQTDGTTAGIADSSAKSTTYSIQLPDLTAGQATLNAKVYGLDGCSTSFVTATKKIILDDIPSISAGTTDSACGKVYTLKATKNIGTGKWTKTSGAGNVVFSDSTNMNSTATIDVFNVYDYLWTVTNGKCSVNKSVKIQYFENPSSASAGSNTSVCGLTTNLNATPYTYLSGSNINIGIKSWKTDAAIVTPSSSNSSVNAAAPGTYTYSWIETNGKCSVKKDVQYTFNLPPTANPSDEELCYGKSIQLDGNPSKGTGTINNHSWTGNVSILSGTSVQKPTVNSSAAASTYNLTYTVKDDKNCSDSKNITVTVYSLPSISSQPANTTICESDTAKFQIVATGTNLSYQWQIYSAGTFIDVTADANHSGEKTNTLSVTNGNSGARYRCIITSNDMSALGLDCATTSNEASLTINTLPTITSQPIDRTICEGASTSFSVNATGNNLSYQWKFKTPSSGWQNVIPSSVYSGVNSASLNINTPPLSLSGNKYLCEITATGGCKKLSNEVLLTINANPSISAQPNDKEVCEDTTTSISLTAGGPGLTYIWQIRSGASYVDLDTSSIYSNTTSNELKFKTINLGLDNSIYRCKLTTTGGCIAYSNSALLDITQKPSIFAGANGEVCSNQTSYTLKTGSGIYASNYSKLVWRTSSGWGSTDSTILLATYTLKQADKDAKKVTLEVIAYGQGSCKPKQSQMELSITPAPEISFTNDGEICENTSYDLSMSNPVVKNQSSLLWTTSGTGQFSSSAIDKPIYTPSIGETGMMILTLQAFGVNSCASVTKQIKLQVTPKPVIDPGSNASVCAGKVFDLSTSSVPPSASEYKGLAWTSNGSGTLTNENGLWPKYLSDASDAGKVVTLTLVATGNGSCLPSASKSMNLTVKSIPKTDPITGPVDFCVNTTQVFRTDLPSGSPFSTYTWGLTNATNAPSLNTFGFSAILDFKSNAYINGKLFVVETNDGCVGDTVYLDVRSYTSPVVDAGSGRTICSGENTTLGGTPTATGGSGSFNYIWAPNSRLDDPFSSNPTANPTITTQYNLSVSDKISGCSAVNGFVSVFVNAVPSTPGVIDKTACYQGVIPPLEASGTNIKWYNNANKDVLLGQGNSYNTGKVDPGTYDYYVTQTVNNCTSPVSKVSLTIFSVPSAPVAQNKAACMGEVIPSLETTGTGIKWYSDAALTQMVSASSIFNTGKTQEGTYTYYVNQTANNCTSPSTPVTLVISKPPVAPSVSDTIVCFKQTIPALKATGDSVEWFTDEALANKVFLGNTFNTGKTSEGSYLYYVTQTKNKCRSPKSIVTLTINPIPVILGVTSTPQSVCNSSDASITVNATGIAPLAYSINGGVSYVSSNVFTNLSQGAYPIRVKNGYNCVVSYNTLAIQHGDAPPPPTVNNNKTYCENNDLSLMSAQGHVSGGLFKWYSDPGLTNKLAEGPTYLPSKTIGSTTYYVTESKDTCQSAPALSIITINTIPPKPLADDKTYCEKELMTLSASGTNIKWYDNPQASGAPLFSGANYNPGILSSNIYKYYITQTISCTSEPKEVTLIVNAIPGTPQSQSITACSNRTIPALNATGDAGSMIYWYNDSKLSLLVDSGASFNTGKTAVGVYDYYVIQKIAGCKSPSIKTSLSISLTPEPPLVSNLDTCVGVKSPVLKAFGLPSVIYKWYGDSLLSGDSYQSTNNTFNTGKINSGTYPYWVTQTLGNCASYASNAVLKIYPIPSRPVALNDTVCFGNPIPDLFVSGQTGATYTWYVEGKKYYGEKLTTGKTDPGAYTDSVTQTLNGCESPKKAVTLFIRPVPLYESSIIKHETYCDLNDGEISITAKENGSIPPLSYSKDNGLVYGASNLFKNLADGSYFIKIKNTYNCETPSVKLTVNAGGPPPKPKATGSVSLCDGQTLNALTAIANLSGSTLTWYDASHDSVGSGTSYQPPYILGERKYYVTETIGGCESDATELTVVINSIPDAPVSTNATICKGDSVPVLSAKGQNIIWYNASTKDSVLAKSATYKPISYTGTQTHTLYVTQTVNGCESPVAPVQYTINPIPASLVIAPQGACFGKAIPNLITAGTNVKWYSDSSLKSKPINLGDTLKPDTTKFKNVGIYTFYVTQTIKNCPSLPSKGILRIDTVPPVPFGVNQEVCANTKITPYLKAYGQNVRWYTKKDLSDTPVKDSIQVGLTGPSMFVRYATQTLGNCQGPALADTLFVIAPPLPPITTNAAVCENITIPALSATGKNLKWYTITDSLLCDKCSIYDTKKKIAGVYEFNVTQTESFCESDPAKIKLSIYGLPVFYYFSAKGEEYCNTKDGSISIYARKKPLFYSIDNGLTFQSDSFFLNLSNGSYPMAVKDMNGCKINIGTAIVSPGSNPPAPKVSPDTTYCNGQVIKNIWAIGVKNGKLKWFSDPALKISMGLPGDTFVVPTNSIGKQQYFVYDSIGSCISPVAISQLTINALPTAEVLGSASICENETAPLNFKFTGKSPYSYSYTNGDDTFNTIALNQLESTIVSDSGDWKVTQLEDGNGCYATDLGTKAHITVNPLPKVILNGPSEMCNDGSTRDLTFELTGTKPFNLQYTFDDDTTIIASLDSSKFILKTNKKGLYQATYLKDANGCVADDLGNSLAFDVHELPSGNFTGSDTLCNDLVTPAVLTIQLNGNGPWNYTYTRNGSSPVTLATNYSSNTISTISDGIFRLSNIEDMYGCQATDLGSAAVVTRNSLPSVTVIKQDSICYGDSAKIELNLTGKAPWIIKYSLGVTKQTPDTAWNSPFIKYLSNLSVGITNYRIDSLIDGNGCSRALINYYPVKINLAPDTPKGFPVNLSKCMEDDGKINITPLANPKTQYSISDTAHFVNTFDFTDLSLGIYPIIVKNEFGCITYGDSVPVKSQFTPNPPNGIPAIRYCQGDGVGLLQATSSNAPSSGIFNWYLKYDRSVEYKDSSVSVYPLKDSLGKVNYYVTELIDTCESLPTKVTVTIDSLPKLPLATSDTACYSGNWMKNPKLFASGKSLKWYTYQHEDSIVGTGSSFLPQVSSPGNYIFYVTQTINGCRSEFQQASLKIKNRVDTAISIGNEICEGGSNILYADSFNIKWYLDYSKRTFLDTGHLYYTNKTNPGSYTFYATQTIDGCEGPARAAQLIIKGKPSLPTAKNIIVCQGESVPSLFASGVDVKWYDSLKVYQGDDNAFNPGLGDTSKSGTYVFFATQTLNGCTSDYKQVTVTIKPRPAAPAIDPVAPYCKGEKPPILEAKGIVNNANVIWYRNLGNEILQQNNVLYALPDLTAGSYLYTVSQKLDGCESERSYFNIKVNNVPIFDSYDLVNESYCSRKDGKIEIFAQDISNSLKYSIDGGINFSEDALFMNLSPGSYQLMIKNLNCSVSGPMITVAPGGAPVAPALTPDKEYCFGDIMDKIIASPSAGGSINWYGNINLTNLLLENNIQYIPNDSVGTHEYFATEKVGQCESPATKVSIKVNGLPPRPIGKDAEVCFGSPVPSLNAIGSHTINWYKESNLSKKSFLFTGATYISGVIDSGTHKFYINQVDEKQCVSASDTVSLTIHSIPDAPLDNAIFVCSAGTIPDLNAKGSNIKWYAKVTKDSLLQTGNVLQHGKTKVGDYTFFATQSMFGCESEISIQRLKIKATPDAPGTYDTIKMCQRMDIEALFADGEKIKWYSASGVLLDSFINKYIPNIDNTKDGLYTFFATQTVDGCESPKETTLLKVNIQPDAPETKDTSVCIKSEIPILFANGFNISWYSDFNATIKLGEGNFYDTKQISKGSYTYFATQTLDGCESTPASATLTINNIPKIRATGTSETYCKLQDGTITINAVGSSAGLLQYSINGTDFKNNGYFDNLKSGTYYPMAKNSANCTIKDTIVIKPGVPPPAPSAGPEDDYCSDQTPEVLRARRIHKNSIILWFSNQELTNKIATVTDSVCVPSSSIGTHQYYAVDSLNGCKSPATMVQISILEKPAPPQVQSYDTCANEIIPNLIASGLKQSIFSWYKSKELDDTPFKGNSISFQQEPGFYQYYVTQTLNGCESDYTEASMNIKEAPELEVPAYEVKGCPPFSLSLVADKKKADIIHWYINDTLISQFNNKDTLNYTLFNNTPNVSYNRVRTEALTNGKCKKVVSNDFMVYPKPDFDFEPVPAELCKPLNGPARFQFVSKPGGSNYTWDFGDNNTENSDAFPTHNYNFDKEENDTLTVKLTAVSKNYNCVESFKKKIVIFPSAKPGFTVSSDDICAPKDVIFTDTSTNAVKWNWDFGDGSKNENTKNPIHLYKNKDLMRTDFAELTIETVNKCQETARKSIKVKPEVNPDFTRDSANCSPFLVTFNNLHKDRKDSSVIWSFGDGSPDKKATETSYTYLNYGETDTVFKATLKVISKDGCRGSIVKDIVVYPTLNAVFELDTDKLCAPHKAIIFNESKGAFAYEWTFGDGVKSIEKNDTLIHYYKDPLDSISYLISLKIRNSTNICHDTLSKRVVVNPSLQARIKLEDSVCSPFLAKFENVSVGAGRLFYDWDFGDGNIANTADPINRFLNSTAEELTRTITLKLRSEYGCEHDTAHILHVFPTPEAGFIINPGQQRYPASVFEFINHTNKGPWTYKWDFGDGEFSSETGDTVVHVYKKWGTKSKKYKIPVLLITSMNTCSDSAKDVLTLYPPLPKVKFDTVPNACEPATISITPETEYADTYTWYFGDGTTSNERTGVKTYDSAGVYTIKLLVEGEGGSETFSNILVVHPNPTAMFDVLPKEVMIPDDVIKCYNLSNEGASYLWNFGDEDTSSEFSPKHKYTKEGKYSLSLLVVSPYGCRDSITLDTIVTVGAKGEIRYPNAFFPNLSGPQGGSSGGKNPNTVFKPYLQFDKSVKEYHFEIYNRWGARVFSTNNVEAGWDGYFQGKLCPQDVYVYKAWGKFQNGQTFIKAGDITLLQRKQ